MPPWTAAAASPKAPAHPPPPDVSDAANRTSGTPRTRRLSPARMAKYRSEKDAIMRAAYDLILRNGSSPTSVHDILHETGFSTRTFYRHFRSKDELLVAMYRVDSDRVAETLT